MLVVLMEGCDFTPYLAGLLFFIKGQNKPDSMIIQRLSGINDAKIIFFNLEEERALYPVDEDTAEIAHEGYPRNLLEIPAEGDFF